MNINPNENFVNALNLTGDMDTAMDAYNIADKARMATPEEYLSKLNMGDKLRYFADRAVQGAKNIAKPVVNAMNSAPGKLATSMMKTTPIGGILNAPGVALATRAGRAIVKKAVPVVGTLATLYDLGVIGASTYNNLKAHKDLKDQMDINEIYEMGVRQGEDPVKLWQVLNMIDENGTIPMRNGKPVNIAQAPNEVDNRFANINSDEALKRGGYMTPSLGKEYAPKKSTPIANNTKNEAPNDVPTELPVMPQVQDQGQPPVIPPVNNQAQPAVPPSNELPIIAGVPQDTEAPAQGAPVPERAPINAQGIIMANQAPSIEQQMRDSIINPQGAITPQDLSNKLAELYQSYRDTAQNNYLYNGDMIDPRAGQYNVDPRQLELASNYDMIAKGFGAQGGMADTVMHNAQQMYNARMGNQLGVPYENYVTAMGERQKHELLSRANEINHQLEVAKQQATTTKDKLAYLQEQDKLRNAYNMKLAEIDADVANNIRNNQNKIAVQDLVNRGNLAERKMQEMGATTRTSMELPYHQTYSDAMMLNALSMISDPRQRAAMIMYNPGMQERLFQRRLNPQNPNDMNILNAFIQQSYGIQMNPVTGQFAQPKGFLQSVADRIQGNKQ